MRKLIALGAVSLTLAFACTSFGAGADIFKKTCLPCHGNEGSGTAMAPAFEGNAWLKGASPEEVAAVVTKGRAGAAKRYKQFALDMPPQPLKPEEVKEVVQYIKGLAAK